MTTNKLGTSAQQPLYVCTCCYDKCAHPADHLRVYGNECWCNLCWDERRGDFPDLPCWNDLEPYTPAWQAEPAPAQDDQYPPCDYCGVIPDHHPWHGSGMFNGEDSPHIHACTDCRHLLPSASEQQPAPDVDVLVEVLEKARDAIGSLPQDALGNVPDTQQRQGWHIRDELINEISAALAAHRKGGAQP